ncbi:MAG: hypothetical protein LUP95_01135 [Euryarchaeota archaeon]|nr:hypothetical protein [Euryarchaeota archaeon]
MDRRYAAALLAVVVVLITVRVGYALTSWGDSVDQDPWKLLGDTNRYVITGHYSAGEDGSLYYGAYSVGLQSLLASFSVFTGIDLITLAQYFLQVIVPIVMVLVIYLVTSRSGTIMSWAIPLMCLFIGLYSGIIHQQSRMIEENVGFLLFCGALFFLYLYYDARRISRTYTLTMLSAILLLAIFTHHISFLVIAVLSMPFIVSALKYVSPAYIPLIFVPWWLYYHALNGYNGVYVGIFFYTAIGLAALYALFLLFRFVLPASESFQAMKRRVKTRAHRSLLAFSCVNNRVGELTIILGAVAIVYSLLTGLQSGYLPYFLPLVPLVVYSATSSFLTSDPDERVEWLNAPFIRYMSFTVALLIVITALGFALQYTASRTGVLPPNFQSIEALAAVDLGNRFLSWVAFLWGLMATTGLISIIGNVQLPRRALTASVTAVLLALTIINTAALAANYDTSFAITAPPDRTVIATASWAKDKDAELVTMTDYNSAMLYWYYANEPVAYIGTSERPNSTVLDSVYPGYLTEWNSSRHVGIDYLLLTSAPPVYYYEHLLNGQWKLSNQDTPKWQARLTSINNRDGIDKIYTNNHTNYYKVVNKARA